MMNTKLEKMRGSDRQILLIASDNKYEELKRNNQKIPLLGYPSYDVLSTLAVQGFLALEKNLGEHRFRSQIEKFRRNWGDLKMLRVEPSEAMKLFTFSDVPSDGSVFRVNPFNERQYLAPSFYTEHVAREKVGAFIRIASTLGAKQIRLMSATVEKSGWLQKASIREVATQIGIAAQFEGEKIIKESVYADFGKPDTSPFVPHELKNWIDSVPEVRALVKNRLDGKPIKLSCQLLLDGSKKSEARVIAGWDLVGLDVGGKHKKLNRSLWTFQIEFWQ